jgi:endo-1,4-beta-xylanase
MHPLRTAVLILFLALPGIAVAAEPEVVLWPDGAPGSEGKTAAEVVDGTNITSVHRPSITVFLPAKDKATGVGVLVVPGGGHRMLCVGHEGFNVAHWLTAHGIAAFMLKYRLAREPGSTYTIEGHALPDTQRALRVIRAHSAEWGVDPARVGGMGFSAGGELVALAAMRPEDGAATAADPLDRLPARLAFQALIYPGRSGDVIPTKDIAPAFLACSANDRQDISEGLAEMYLRFKRAGAPCELHVYATGGHGFGVQPNASGALAGWTDRFMEWLVTQKFLSAGK